MESNKLTNASGIVNSINDTDSKNIKRIKSDKGLIEKVVIDKVIITEDNKRLLID